MTDQLQQAAERLRRYAAADKYNGECLAIYGCEGAQLSLKRDTDRHVLADAYLAMLSAPSPDTAEARAVLEKMTVEPWEPDWPMLDSCNRENREGIAHLRNHAAAWLDEIDRLRAKCEAMEEAGDALADRVRFYRGQSRTDDAEPVTEEWLRSVGFTNDIDKTFWNLWAGRTCAELGFDAIQKRWFAYGIEIYPAALRPTTRGQARKLCSILGIQLEEKR